MPSEKNKDAGPNFFSWPAEKVITFASAMNLLKTQRKIKPDRCPTVLRNQVYKNITRKKVQFTEVFQRKMPSFRPIYTYLDELTGEGYFTIVDKMELADGKEIRNLTSTQKADKLYEWLWISINLKSKEDIGRIVDEQIKNMTNLSEEEKKNIVTRSMKGLADKKTMGFPFSISKEALEVLLKDKE